MRIIYRNRVLLFWIPFLILIIRPNQALTQNAKHKISVLTPIYLDSAFSVNTFKILDNSIPKNMLQGLEFYYGALKAVDSLKNEGIKNLQIEFIDYRSKGNSLPDIIKINRLSDSKIIIADFNKYSDVKLLADYTNQKKIPLISASFPNDGGVNNNPLFFLLNPTLETHCKAIYSYIQSHHLKDNIIYIKCNGGFENIVEKAFVEIEDKEANNRKLNLISKQLIDSFTNTQLFNKLDSTKSNTILCNCASEKFAGKLLTAVGANKSYKVNLIGMPTWDAIKNIKLPETNSAEFIYTSAYNFTKSNTLLDSISSKYTQQFFAAASDFYLKGYETMLRCGKLVSLYGEHGIQLFSDNMFTVFSELDIKPKFNYINPLQIDYYENSKIYFLKKY